MIAASAAVYFVLLLTAAVASGARLYRAWADRLCAAAIIVWGILCYTGLALSIWNLLGNRAAWVGVSGALIGATYLYTRRCEPVDYRIDRAATPWPQLNRNRYVLVALGLTCGVALMASCVIASAYYPNNWDSCAYRIPRAFFYRDQGNLLHFASRVDPRLVFYPFNGTLLYVVLALFSVDGRVFTFVSLFLWMLVGCATYAGARRLGASKTYAAVSVWAILLSPIVLCLATSTNDEIFLGAALACAYTFLVGWLEHGNTRDAVLAGLAGGIALGTKLHWIFFWPLALIVPFLLRGRMRVRTRPGTGWFLLCAVAAPLAATSFVANYISAHALTHTGLKREVMNTPFSATVARQTTTLYSTQLLLSPIPDVIVGADPALYERFDETLARYVKEVQQGPPFTHPSYRFRGVADPSGYMHFEQTLWLGFWPHLLILLLIAELSSRRHYLVILGLVAFLAWHFGFSTSMRYAETVGVYYSVPAILAAAAMGPALQRAMSRTRWRPVIASAAVFVFATHCLAAVNVLAFNGRRNIRQALSGGIEQSTVPAQSQIGNALRSAKHIRFLYSHWETLYFHYILHNPEASYSLATIPASGGRGLVNLAAIESRVDAGGQLAYLNSRRRESFAYLGTAGADLVLASGDSNLLAESQVRGIEPLPCSIGRTGSDVAVICGANVPGFRRPQPPRDTNIGFTCDTTSGGHPEVFVNSAQLWHGYSQKLPQRCARLTVMAATNETITHLAFQIASGTIELASDD